MLGIIKSAIITITISFISGVLLDHYKNSAPKILCNMKKSSKVRGRNKGIKAYILTVKNASKKTIHNLNINLQSKYKELKIDNAKITNGLKFEIASEYNNHNVSIPFLSKDDEFSVKLFVEDTNEGKNKPIVTLRSPEDFKKINSNGDKGVKDLLQNVAAIFLDKRVIAIAAAVFLVCGGITVSKYLLNNNKETQSTVNESSNNSLKDNDKNSTDTSKKSATSNGKSKSQDKQENKKDSSVDSSKSKSSSSTNTNSTKETDSKKSDAKENSTESSGENSTSKSNEANIAKGEESKNNSNSNKNNERKTSTGENDTSQLQKSSEASTAKESN